MRITISHDRPKTEIIEAVDRSFNDLFKSSAQLPVKITVQERTWRGSILNFALTAKWGLFSTPIKGTVEVTDHSVPHQVSFDPPPSIEPAGLMALDTGESVEVATKYYGYGVVSIEL